MTWNRRAAAVLLFVPAWVGGQAVQSTTIGVETAGSLDAAATPAVNAGGADVTGEGLPATEYAECEPSAPQITFGHGYTVSMCFEYDRDGELVQADALDFGLGSRQSGLLYFFDRDNAEVLIKVLDACAVNGHRWVFVAPVTTLAFNLRVEETATGKSWTHRNPRGGGTATTKSDVTAFPCAPASSSGVGGSAGGAIGGAAGPVDADVHVSPGAPSVRPAADVRAVGVGGAADCTPQPVTTLDGGFTVNMCVEYLKEGAPVVGTARDYGLDSSQSALLYFFERDNAEVLIKVLDACAVNGHRWVFVAPVTTLAFNLSITRRSGGTAWTHSNRLDETAAAKSDIQAFACATDDDDAGDDPGDDPGDDDRTGGPNSFDGQVVGYVGDYRDVEVLLTAKGVLRVERPDAHGWFRFPDLPDGEYAVKALAQGYRATPARLISVPTAGRVEPFDLTPIPANPFVFHWEEDQSTAGTEYSAAVNRPLEIEFLDEGVAAPDHSSATILLHDYNILLVDSDEASWSQEHAWRLLTTMRSIPHDARNYDEEQSLAPSQWLLTPGFLHNDIQIRTDRPVSSVLISEAAFVYANPRVASVEGKRGIWFSKRLHHALVRYVTGGGTNSRAYEKIFRERYGVTTVIDDYAGLTAPTGNESAARFQPFHAEEILILLNMLEEFPSGLRKTQGLDYLIRRLDGTDHPLYPEAPAVAWPQAGYIEFMDQAFLAADVDHVQRLVIHEKAHFLWAHVFDEVTREDWIEMGGWYEDPQAGSGWSTTKETEFVSAYGHAKNPDEDMAETVSYFIIEPDKLRSRSLAKYEFVRDRIMQGDFYLSRIREDLTFPVYNLYPDYVFPGKVRRVDITVTGGPRDDKEFRIEIELHALDKVLEGAAYAYARVNSDVGTYFELYLSPVNEQGDEVELSTVLVGTATLSKYSKAGYWNPSQLVIGDLAGNERFQRSGAFGWKLFLDNPLEDWTPPEYVRGTARLSGGQEAVQGRLVQTIEAGWRVEEDVGMEDCYARINDEIPGTYALEEYRGVEPDERQCRVVFPMPDYMPSSEYSLNFIRMKDLAANWSSFRFTDDPRDERPQTIRVETANPDTEAPELDLNRIGVEAEPTNPEEPNGETIVRLTLRIRDNISGYTHALINFLDPQGVTHYVYHYEENRGSIYPTSDVGEWKVHSVVHVLPPGSVPGIWGVSDATLYDRARNFVQYDFTEVIHFDVE